MYSKQRFKKNKIKIIVELFLKLCILYRLLNAEICERKTKIQYNMLKYENQRYILALRTETNYNEAILRNISQKNIMDKLLCFVIASLFNYV